MLEDLLTSSMLPLLSGLISTNDTSILLLQLDRKKHMMMKLYLLNFKETLFCHLQKKNTNVAIACLARRSLCERHQARIHSVHPY
jgi:hypothetical protein